MIFHLEVFSYTLLWGQYAILKKLYFEDDFIFKIDLFFGIFHESRAFFQKPYYTHKVPKTMKPKRDSYKPTKKGTHIFILESPPKFSFWHNF